MLASTPVPTWYVSPTRPSASTASIAAAVVERRGSTPAGSRVDAYSGSALVVERRVVTNSGSTFSGNWYGP